MDSKFESAREGRRGRRKRDGGEQGRRGEREGGREGSRGAGRAREEGVGEEGRGEEQEGREQRASQVLFRYSIGNNRKKKLHSMISAAGGGKTSRICINRFGLD